MGSRRRFVVGTVAVALLAGVGVQTVPELVVPAPVAAVEPDDDAAGQGPLTRPDAVSAMVTAQATGERVENLGGGDAMTRVFANPDGTWTSDTTAGPQRVRDEAGEWVEVDTTLEKVDGRLVPKAAAVEMSFSLGGDKAFADAVPVADGEHGTFTGATKGEMEWQWPTVLPEPKVDGSTATYEDAVPGGGDLVVIATATGFTHNIVLHEIPEGLKTGGSSAEPTDAPSDTAVAGPVYEIPVVTPGSKMVESAGGSLKVSDAAGAGKGEEVAAAPTPLMWDSSKDPDTGDPVVKEVDTTLTPSTTANGTPVATVSLVPSVEFLTDPATVYPVTIDPTWQLLASFDTWVSTNFPSSQASSPFLRVGTKDGVAKGRAYMVFPGDAVWDGTQIVKADLILRNYKSQTCTAGAIRASRISQNWWSSSLTITNGPTVSTPTADFSPAYGASGCAANEATWNVTSMVQGWADNTFPNNGVRLAAASETNPNTFREYWSLEHGIDRPRIVTTYNRQPGTATGLVVEQQTTYAPPGESPDGSAASNFTWTRQPKVSAKVSDPDGGKVKVVIRAFATSSTSSADLGTCTGALVAVNTASSCVLPALPDNTTVFVRAKALDQSLLYAGGSLAADAGWSAPTELRV